ncbi:MAG: site-specific integrase, partial [Actinomycetota bacterium]|nr:site-specific integrase [Actinomycetota bacterium]
MPFPAGPAVPLARLRQGKTAEVLVFADTLGCTRTDESSRGWFSPVVRRARVPTMTPHDRRHTATSLAAQVRCGHE